MAISPRTSVLLKLRREDEVMKNAPCKDCPERGCGTKHDTCEAYQEWLAERIASKQEQTRHRLVQNAIAESVLRIKRKAKK